MNRFTKSTTQWLLIILFFSNVLSTIAQPQIIEAKIEDRRSNQLEVTFSESVRLNNANGFRLVGGVARIKALINGSGSNRLTFSLTDHVLPDDQFSLLHWPELSDAFASSGKLPAFNDVPVDNQASSYRGNGNLFFVANNGSDASSGRNPSSPLRSIDKALSLARPGDYILLKRGDSWPQFAVRNTNGQSGKPITIAAYGSGNKPRIRVNRGNGISIIDSDFITLDNLHVRMESSRKRGVYFTGNTSNPVISNSLVECTSSMGFYGIDFGDKDGSRVTNPTVLNNVVRKFRWNIRSSGFPYDGTHNVYGGLIENNISAGNFNAPDARDGISAQRGNFHGLIIRKNEVFGWVDDAMDFYASDNVIVEYNTIHDPLNFSSKASGSGSGNALKVGGTTSSADRVGGKSSTNIVVRYNQVYNVNNNLNSGAHLNAIVTNGGKSGEIYGNLIFNVGGAGIKVDGSPKDWKIYNNTVYDAKKGFDAYSTGGNPSNVRLENNILHGRRGSITANTFGRGNVRGEKNLFLSGQAKGDYAGSNDISSTADKVFASTRDLTLKDNAPAVDNGISINAYKKDRRGFAINDRTDIGAHELSDGVTLQNPEPEPEPEPEPDPISSGDGSSIQIIAAGRANDEQMTLRIGQDNVKAWNNIGGDARRGQFRTFSYQHDQPVSINDIQLALTQVGSNDSDLRIDKIILDGVTYQTEAPSTYSTGTWTRKTGIKPGYYQSEWLHSRGYFHFMHNSSDPVPASSPAPEPEPDPISSSDGSTIQVIAAGSANDEQMTLRIGQDNVKTWNNVGGDARRGQFRTFSYQHDQSVNIDDIQLALTQVGSNDSDLRIDKIILDGATYQTEAPSTYSTGTWTRETGIKPGYYQSEWLHSRGYFHFMQGGVHSARMKRFETLSKKPDMEPERVSSDRLSEFEIIRNFKLFPNPITDHFTIQVPVHLKISQIRIIDLQGRSIFTKKYQNAEGNVRIDTYKYDFPAGKYNLLVNLSDGSVKQLHLLVK